MEGDVLVFSHLYRVHQSIVTSCGIHSYEIMAHHSTCRGHGAPAVGENQLLLTRVFQLQHYGHCRPVDSLLRGRGGAGTGRGLSCATSSLFGLCPLDASTITLFRCDNSKCLEIWPNIPWQAKSALAEYNWDCFYL